MFGKKLYPVHVKERG